MTPDPDPRPDLRPGRPLLLDSRSFYSRGDILRMDLPPVANVEDTTSVIERTWNSIRKLFRRTKRPVLEEAGPANGKSLPEVQQAFAGQQSSVVRINARGETIVSVAVPIQRFRAVQGVLLLSTQEGDIDAIIASERFALLQVFLVAAVVMIVLSLFLAGAIAGPVRRLAEAAERVRWGTKSRQEIPDFTGRSDEIGHLSGALRDMTRALYNRIDAIESFAADVAHELKNPLTSLRSAVETLPLARSDDSRQRLMSIIQHDVKRLDRLISDISDASRLDAELARADAEPVDMVRLLEAVVSVANERRQEHEPLITLNIDRQAHGRDAFLVLGHDSRLGQVFNNLIDNARSFSPARRDGAGVDPAPQERGRDPGGGQRARHRARRPRPDLRALLHRPARAGLRPEFGPRPVDLAADHRGPSRHDPRREPARLPRRDRRAPAPRRPLRHPPAHRRGEGQEGSGQEGPGEEGQGQARAGEEGSVTATRPSMPAACSSARRDS